MRGRKRMKSRNRVANTPNVPKKVKILDHAG